MHSHPSPHSAAASAPADPLHAFESCLQPMLAYSTPLPQPAAPLPSSVSAPLHGASARRVVVRSSTLHCERAQSGMESAEASAALPSTVPIRPAPDPPVRTADFNHNSSNNSTMNNTMNNNCGGHCNSHCREDLHNLNNSANNHLGVDAKPKPRRTSFCDAVLHADIHVNGGTIPAYLRRRSSVVREKWSSKMEFLLAVVGYAVDLGNIWRFPAICYKHGGGAFLIPYVVMLCVGGLPMFYMELVMGQFHKSGCVSIWKKICPMFKGIGYGICFVCTFIACFYNAIIAHSLYFFFQSLAWDVPWRSCGNEWNTDQCSESVHMNQTVNANGLEWRTPSQEYYLFKVLEIQRSSGFDDLGGIKWSMAVCLFLVFMSVYFALWKGPSSAGKVVWITSTAPYLVLTILLVRGLTLPGAYKGIQYYITPDFQKLLEPAVWTAAATQIFFSLGPGFGVLLALSSYNDYNNNCYRDAVVTSIINCFTSFFSGFVIFSTLGYMSELTNKPVSEVVGESESSLIFVVYPQAIATMSYSSVWSVIFFLMLIALGIDSTFAGIEALITGLIDEYPRLLGRKRELFVLVVVGFYFIGSLPAVTYGGTYVIPFLDSYGVSLSVLFIVMCEMIAVCWFYGINRFSEDIRIMLGFYPGLYWRVCWMCAPIFIALIFGLALYETSFSPIELPNYVYPWWSVHLGWVFRLLSCLSVPSYMIYMFLTTEGTVLQRLSTMVKPQQRHTHVALGTALVENKGTVQLVHNHYRTHDEHHAHDDTAHL